MPARTRNSLSATQKKLAYTRNLRNNKQRSQSQRKASGRSLHRRTDASTIGTDTIYSIILPSKNENLVKLYRGDEDIISSETDLIQAIKDIATIASDELADFNQFSKDVPWVMIVELHEHIQTKLPKVQIHLEKHDYIPDQFQLAMYLYYDFDQFYLVSFQFLWSLAGNSKTFQNLIMTALHILSPFVNNCFEDYMEEGYIENLKNVIEEEEQHFAEHGKLEEKESFELEMDNKKNEVAFYESGEFAQLKKRYLNNKKTWQLKNIRAKTTQQKALLQWFRKIEKINHKWELGNDEDAAGYGMDGCVNADSLIYIPYTTVPGEYLYNVVGDMDDEVNNFGTEQLVFKALLSKECKEPTIPKEFFGLLEIMNFEYEYPK